MKKVVADGASNRYRVENIKFMLYLYDNEVYRETVLEEWFVIEMEKAVEEDNKNPVTKKKRPNARQLCKEKLDNMNYHDRNSCPIILPSIDFNIFSHYITSRKKETDGSYLGVSSYGNIRSAFNHLHRSSGQQPDPDMAKRLSHFMSGLKRTSADSKARSGKSLNEGKRPMSMAVYERMCHHLYEGEDDEYLFGHAFLTMEWNLMARSDNCVHMTINNIQWQDDCLLFFFGKSKSNQLGANSDKPWHVYSNPEKPHCCPVLALCKYLFAHPDLISNPNSLLFPGTHQYSRFIRIFHKVLNQNNEEFEALGVLKGDLGSHSTRKGSITLVSAGCTVSPPMSSICLRACWSMGPVKDRYIHYKKAGDQFVG